MMPKIRLMFEFPLLLFHSDRNWLHTLMKCITIHCYSYLATAFCILNIPLNLSISNKHAKKNLIMIPFWPLKMHIFFRKISRREKIVLFEDVNITNYVKCLLSKCFSKKWTYIVQKLKMLIFQIGFFCCKGWHLWKRSSSPIFYWHLLQVCFHLLFNYSYS